MGSTKKHQQGLTFISLIFILAILGFFVLLILKIGPIYMDHYRVVNALKALETTPGIAQKSPDEIRLMLSKRFNMNYVSTINAKDIQILQHGSYLKVQATYEVVEKIIGNASVLVNFDDKIEVGENS
jgi:hypothetical protein